jgi:hypothetical protein
VQPGIVYLETTYRGYVKDERGRWLNGGWPVTATASCSGFFVNHDGHIVTAGHCVDKAEGRSALIQKALEASGRPLVVSNVDLSRAHVGGLGSDVVSRFLEAMADGAGLTLHVRLIEGEETEHVLEAIFKALGVALAQACRPRTLRLRGETSG